LAVASFTIQSTKGKAVVSPTTVINQFLTGIPLNGVSEDSIAKFIDAASKHIEGYLNIKLQKQIIKETLHYKYSDFMNWGYMQTNFPVMKIHKLLGKIGQQDQIDFPLEWLTTNTTSDGLSYQKSVFMVPSTIATAKALSASTGISAFARWFASDTIPHYWEITYCTSFNTIPQDIIEVIGKMTAINVLQVVGDLIGGAGIGGSSLGIDGLNESTTLTKSAGQSAFSGRQKLYSEEVANDLKMLKYKYDGFIFSVL